MEIFLSINNREQVIKLPVTPNVFNVKSPWGNNKFETINQGEIKIIGQKGLRSLSIQSFFPVKDYSFIQDKTYIGWEYVDIIEKWRERRVPVRLVITDTPINLAVTIDEFDYGTQDGTGDIYYTLTLSEYKFISLQEKRV